MGATRPHTGTASADEPRGRWLLRWDVPGSTLRARRLSDAGRWGALFHHLDAAWRGSSRLDRLGEKNHARHVALRGRLPPRVLTVFGHEGSGTKLLSELVATAAGIFNGSDGSWHYEEHAVWRTPSVSRLKSALYPVLRTPHHHRGLRSSL